MERILTTGLAGLVLTVQTVPTYTQPLTYDPATFDAAAIAYATTATGDSAVMMLPNPIGGADFEITMPARFEAKASERSDE
jgi:hypothetical protein